MVDYVSVRPMLLWSVYGGAAFLGITFAIAVVRTVARSFSPDAQRKKTVNKNKV